MRGSEACIQAGWVTDHDWVIDAEPTNGQIQMAHKGRTWYEIDVQGHTAHASTPWKGADAIAAMKRGVRVINLARGEIVDDEAMLTALDTGMVAAYITDFPNNRLLTAPHVIAMPHLGASTPESEQNCAAMAVDTLRDYLESGNIRSSVNLPEMTMDRSGVQRLCVLHKNVPGMLANITSLFGRDGVNVENLSNKSRGDYAYTMVDLGSKVGDNVIEDVRRTANVIRVRSLEW